MSERFIRLALDCLTIRTIGINYEIHQNINYSIKYNTLEADPSSLMLTISPPTDSAETQKIKGSIDNTRITEFAAILLTALIVEQQLDLDLETTQIGDSGDYFLRRKTDGSTVALCEISGTVNGNLTTRFKKKSSQVQKNRAISTCFVSTTRFKSRNGKFSQVR